MQLKAAILLAQHKMKTIIQRLEADEFKQILDGEKSYIVFKGEAQSGQRILLQTETEELDCTVGLVATSPGVFKGHSILTLQRPAEKVPPRLEFDFDDHKIAGTGLSERPIYTPSKQVAGWIALAADGLKPAEEEPTTTPTTTANGDTPIN